MSAEQNEIRHTGGETTVDDDNVLRVFLMGKTGSGKSATGNTILGVDNFLSEASLKSVTTDVEMQETVYDDMTVKVMDSPGLFDTEQSEAEVAAVLMKAVASLHPGPHVLLFVVRFGRYTAEDHAVYSRLQALMDDRIRQHTIVVFTHADELSEKQTQSIHQVISEGPENLQKLMADCGNRFALFNNLANDKKSQVADLMKVVMKVKNDNNNQPYQCPKYAYVAEKIEEETRKRLEEVEKKEMERSQHYQRLEEQLRKKDEQLMDRQKELDKRAEELNRRESKEIQRLMDKIQALEQQLQTQANKTGQEQEAGPRPAQPDAEQERRLSTYKQHVSQLSDQLNTLQDELNTKERDLAAERQKVMEMNNNQTVEINIKAENEKLKEEIEQQKTKQSQENGHEKQLVREQMDNMAQHNEAYRTQLEEQTKKLKELTKLMVEAQEKVNAERRGKDDELAEARRQTEQLIDSQVLRSEMESKRSRICNVL